VILGDYFVLNPAVKNETGRLSSENKGGAKSDSAFIFPSILT
jgi:hypothetical protein